MGARLEDRKTVLARVIKEIPYILEIVQPKECHSVEEVFEEFNQSIHRNEEGIILKKPDSPYRPNERSPFWIKLKGEYLDDLGDTLDLIIIGGYFGERKRMGNSGQDWTDHVSVFLTGVIKRLDRNDPEKCLIYPFSRVGTGYSQEELDQLRAKLKPHWRPYDARFPPALFGRWVPSMSDRPDVYLPDPSQSIVLEIRAGELQVSDQYPTLYTLRFPRVLKVRYDKNWDQAFTDSELQDMVKNFQETRRLKKKQMEGEDPLKEIALEADEPGKRKKKHKGGEEEKSATTSEHDYQPKIKMQKLVEFYRETDSKDLVIKSGMFKGMEFYIVNVDEKVANKPYLESRILENGGRRVQNLLPSTTHIIADQ